MWASRIAIARRSPATSISSSPSWQIGAAFCDIWKFFGRSG